MSTRDKDALLRLAQAVADGTAVDWTGEAAAHPELRPQLEKLRALAGIAALDPDAALDPLIGKTLSHYRIRERLGAGGMGVVYRAEDERLRRPVALKVLPREWVASEQRRRRLLREARAEAAAVHPSIAAIYEIGEAEGHVFIVMELVEGQTLQQRIGGQALPIRETLRIAAEMAEGLAHAHGAGVIHRDLKPANVVVRPDGHVKLLDFGLAKLVADDAASGPGGGSPPETLSADRIRAGRVLGTPAYMSPEQVRGEPLDARSDLFSFGSTLYEMATGKAPFRRPGSDDTLASVLRDEPPPPRRLNRRVPVGLEKIIGRCLEKDPQDRYPGAAELAADLRALADTAAPPLARLRLRLLGPAAAGIAGVLLAAVLLWPPSPPAPEAPPGHTLAVLPFVNMSPDPDQAYFADGIAEELLNTVARFEGLRVVGRTSSFSFRDSDADLKTIGEKLGADVILEGSVRTEGDRARITAQLVDARDGVHRWSETYDRRLKDILTVQTDIARAIADALRVQLSSEQRQRVATRPTQNLAAYQAYLLGRRRLETWSAPSAKDAVGYFEQALALDPRFALAYVGLAQAYYWQVDIGDAPEMLARAQDAADKALELDDHLAEAHAALGQVKHLRNDFEGAEVAFRRALALNPNSAIVLGFYSGLLHHELARYEEGLALSRKAVELDPLSLESMSHLIRALFAVGRFDEGLAWCERALEIEPGYAWGHQLIGFYHWWSGRLDEAVVWWTKGVALAPEDPYALNLLGLLFLDLGDPDRAEHWIQRSVALEPKGFYSNLAMELLAVYRGDEATAREYGRKAFAIFPFDVLWSLRDHEVRAGRYAEARGLYEEFLPELLDAPEPEVDLRNYRAAIDLALILSATGEQERADSLLEQSLQQLPKRPRRGRHGYGIADVQIHALRGETQKALADLREAIDEGWRTGWWYQLRHKPDLEPLHDEPEYQGMVKEIEADMAAQLAHVREMERNGELVFPAAGPIVSGSSRPGPR